jgi:hypothetical protein
VEAEVATLRRTWLEACRDSLGYIIIGLSVDAVNSDVVKPEKVVVTVVCRICDFGPLFNALCMISHIVGFILLVRTVFRYLGPYSVQDDCLLYWLVML